MEFMCTHHSCSEREILFAVYFNVLVIFTHFLLKISVSVIVVCFSGLVNDWEEVIIIIILLSIINNNLAAS